MSFSGDAYRTLGLPPGAPPDEVKRAYRRLAKRYHPDSAGASATARFIAIQGAYESLVSDAARSTRTGHGGSETSEPTRRAPGARPAPGAPGPGGASPPGRGPRPAAPAWDADADRVRATREAYRHRRAPQSAGTGEGAATGGRATGSSSGAGGPATSGRRERMRRGEGPVPKARPGSTSYDGAEADAFEPEWQGATWYGGSSGTYWTINPKEYADPRKHGPEYQARARRATAVDSSAGAGDESGALGSEPRDRWSDPLREPAGTAGSGPATAGSGPASGPAMAGSGPASATWRASPGESARPAPPVAERQRGPLIPLPERAVLALLGWPVPGLAAAVLIGEGTGCSRYAPSCSEPLSLAPVAAQFLVIGLLLLASWLAEVLTVGTLAVLAGAIPFAVLLSAAGAAQAPGEARAVLAGLLALVYLVGVGGAVVGLVRVPPLIRGRTG